jgi:hypothetical protein
LVELSGRLDSFRLLEVLQGLLSFRAQNAVCWTRIVACGAQLLLNLLDYRRIRLRLHRCTGAGLRLSIRCRSVSFGKCTQRYERRSPQ